MDNNYCCVPQCNSLGSHVPRTSFHRFPSEKNEFSKRRRKEWIRILKIGKKITNRMVVCGKHFQPSDFFPQKNGPLHRTNLKKNAVPSKNIPLTSCEEKEEIERKQRGRIIRSERKDRRERLKETQPVEDSTNVDGSDIFVPGLFDDIPTGPSFVCHDPYQLDMDCGIDEELDRGNLASAAEELLTSDVGTQVTSGDLIMCRSFISKMDKKGLNALTGLQSFALLDLLIELLQNEKTLKRHQMPVKDQIILTLMRLKLDISFAALSVFFECSAPTCKTIFKDALEHLAEVLRRAIQWLPKQSILENMPKCFRKYSKTRVVLDCTEVYITKPDCAKCRIMTYSQYYSDHTIKVMVGISPGGVITFLSPIFGGRASDKVIFEQSSILEYLQPHEDAVMVDKGFLIDEPCKNSYIELLRPPFLRHKSQFSPMEAAYNTRIVRARVHVERMIQRIKIFKIFGGKLPWGMVAYIQDIFTVCAGIANMGAPILSEDKF